MLFILTGDIQIGKTRWLQALVAQLEEAGVPVAGVVAPGRWVPTAASDEGDSNGGLGYGEGDSNDGPSDGDGRSNLANGCPTSGEDGGGCHGGPRCGEGDRADGDGRHASAENDSPDGDGRRARAKGADAPAFRKLGIDNELLPGHRIIAFTLAEDDDGTGGRCSQAHAAKLRWKISDEAIAQVNAHFAGLAELAERPVDECAPGLLVVDELGRLELTCDAGLTEAVRLVRRGATKRFPHALIVVRKQLLDLATSQFDTAFWGGIRPISPDDEGAAAIKNALLQ